MAKLRVRDLLNIFAGLSSLDGIRKGPGEMIPFDFSRKVKWNMTKNLIAVEREKEAYDRLERKAAADHQVVNGMPKTPESVARYDAYMAEINGFQDQYADVGGILSVRLDDLLTRPPGPDGKPRPDNEIPQSVLHQLAAIIEE